MKICDSSSLDALKDIDGSTIPVIDKLSLFVSDDISKFSEVWDFVNKKGILNSSTYLKALEQSNPEGLKSYYCMLVNEEEALGMFLFQIKNFNLKKSLNIHTHSDSALDKLWTSIKKGFISNINHDLLIVGNVLITGQYGINYCSKLNIEQKLENLHLSVEAFANYMNKNKGYNIKSILLKDFEKEEDSNVHLPGFSKFLVDPSMYIDIRWNNFEEYLLEIKSKYRVRYKRAVKKGSALSVKEFASEDLLIHKERMFELYKQISQNVSFNLFDLNKNYFIELKNKLGDDITIKGVFIENKLVAYYSLIYDPDHQEMDAHFLGYELESNHENQTYLNILYWILQDSIERKVSKVNLSRTAMEIKSSVGAEGETLFLLLKARNKVMNWFMSKFLDSYVPDNSWQPRSPFKS